MILATLLIGFFLPPGEHGEEKNQPLERIRLEMETNERGDPRYSIRGRFIPLGELMNFLSQKTGLQFQGPESQVANTLVNVAMTHRSLDEILRNVLGSVDLRFTRTGKVIQISPTPVSGTEEAKKWLEEQGVRAAFEADLSYPGFPGATQLYLLVSRIDEEEGRLEKANQRYQAIIRNYPESPDVPQALLNLSRNHIKVGQIEKASGYLFNLVGQYPRFENLSESYYLLGRVLLQLGNPDRAVKHLELMIEQFPKPELLPLARIYLAEAKRQLGKAKEALEILSSIESLAMKEIPLRQEFLLIFGRCLFDTQDYKKSCSVLFRFFGEFPERVEANPALFQAARAALKGGDLLTAVFLVKTSQDKAGVEPAEWNQLASEIRKELNLNGFLTSTDPSVEMATTADSFRNLGKTKEALEFLERHYDKPDLGGLARLMAARIYQEKSEFEKSAEMLTLAIPLLSDSGQINEAFYLLGDAYIALGNNQGAAEAYQGILRRKP